MKFSPTCRDRPLHRIALCGVLLYFAGQCFALPARADVVVVVSAKSPLASLNAEQVSEIFLGKSAAYPNGADAVPIDQPENSSTRAIFYAAVTGKSPTLLKAYWAKLLFTGQGQPPRELASAAAVRNLISSNAKFIGYIDRDALDDNVKVVFVPR